LTLGDEIDLPVVVRNYLPKPQQVEVEMKPAAWYSQLRAGKQKITIASGDSSTAIFPFRAILPVKAGKQEVPAANRSTGDAISKPVAIHPDGEEKSSTVSDILRRAESLSLNVPDNVIANSMQAELKFYPNLLAHVGES